MPATGTSLTPIEAWLTQHNLAVSCRVVHDDETTEELSVESLTMRGAQREMTGYFIKQGYRPVGRWDSDDQGPECSRRFSSAHAAASEPRCRAGTGRSS